MCKAKKCKLGDLCGLWQVFASEGFIKQVAAQVSQPAISSDGLLTLVLSSSNAFDATGVDNTYTWRVINNSTTTLLVLLVRDLQDVDACPT